MPKVREHDCKRLYSARRCEGSVFNGRIQGCIVPMPFLQDDSQRSDGPYCPEDKHGGSCRIEGLSLVGRPLFA